MKNLRLLFSFLLLSAVLSSAGTLIVVNEVRAESASIHSTALDTTSNPVPTFNFCVTWLKSGASMSFGYRMTDASGNTPSNGYQGGSDVSSSVTWCNGGSVLSWNTSYTVKAWASLNGSLGENPVVATYTFNTGSAPDTTTTISSDTTATTVANTSTKAWTNAPEPNHNMNAIWAMVYQTPEESGYGMVTSFACGPKSTYGLSGTTGGVNVGGGGRLGIRYIYFASSCYDANGNGISTECSFTCFNTSTYVFSIGNGYSRYAGELVAPSVTTTTIPSTTTTTPRRGGNTTSTATTQAPSRGGANPVTTQPRSNSTTTAVDAVEDDGQSEDDFADIGVSRRSGKFDMRISSSFPETEMMLRAFKKGSKSIIWNFTTNEDGNYRILTTRALKGFTLSLWIDGDKWDSLVVR